MEKKSKIGAGGTPHSDALLPRVFEVFGVAVAASVIRAAIVE